MVKEGIHSMYVSILILEFHDDIYCMYHWYLIASILCYNKFLLLYCFTKRMYGTMHKKLCKALQIASPWFASVTTCVSFIHIVHHSLANNACKVWFHGRVYGFLTTRN